MRNIDLSIYSDTKIHCDDIRIQGSEGTCPTNWKFAAVNPTHPMTEARVQSLNQMYDGKHLGEAITNLGLEI